MKVKRPNQTKANSKCKKKLLGVKDLVKMKRFPRILLGSQKLRNKIKARTEKFRRRRRELLKNRLVCDKCKERFATWWEIREHWISSGHKEPEECRWCRKKTYTLQSHICKEHWNLACMCKYCGQLFMFRERLTEHEERHDGVEYRCYLCGRKQNSNEDLSKHIFKHYVYERYGCNVCEKRFKKKKNVEKHLKWVHFICQYCGKTCENKESMVDHWKDHDDLKCVLCSKVFSQKNRLKYHYQMQHGHQDFYKCSLCFQRFSMKSKLLEHLKLKHKGYAKISCETCEMPFLYWSQYLKHFEQVHGKLEDKFSCSFCNFTTPYKIKLQWHVEKTSGDGFFCKVCQTRFQCKTKFDEHMKIHEGSRVYNCEHCDKSYATLDILKHHISFKHQAVIINSTTRGHPCLVEGCNRFYANKNSLSRHMRKNHAGGGPSCSSGQYCAENTVECRFPLSVDRQDVHRKEESIVSSSTQPVQEKVTEKIGYEEVVMTDSLEVSSSKNSIDQTGKEPNCIEVNVYYCDICSKFWFADGNQFRKHMTRHDKQVWDDECPECDEILESPESAVRHYVEEHLKAEYLKC